MLCSSSNCRFFLLFRFPSSSLISCTAIRFASSTRSFNAITRKNIDRVAFSGGTFIFFARPQIQLLSNMGLNLLIELHVILRHKCNWFSCSSSTSRSANSVNVIFRVCWSEKYDPEGVSDVWNLHIVVDDTIYMRDIETSTRDICADEDRARLCFEPCQCAQSFLLTHLSVTKKWGRL